MTTATKTTTYAIPEENWGPLQHELTKLNKRAAKVGTVPAVLTVVGTRDVEIKKHVADDMAPSLPTGIFRRFYDVTVTGETPKFQGWTFIGTLDHATEAGTLLKAVPGHTLPLQYRDAEPVCDHCGHNRRRSETFLVQHENGEIKQIGRQCIRDFLGHANPEQLVKIAEFLIKVGGLVEGSEDEGFYGGGFTPSRVSVEQFMEAAAEAVIRFGFVSRKTAEWQMVQSTANTALDVLFPPKGQKAHERLVPGEAAKALAAETLAYVQDEIIDTERELNDYEHNLRVVLSGTSLAIKNAGIAASAINAYRRDLQRKVERAAAVESQHFGTVGKRETFTLTLSRVVTNDGIYGTTYIHMFIDDAGNRAVWFASKDPEFEIGVPLKVKATVKSHGERDGVKQTVLTRVA
jgi:hypothetical protein